MILIVSIFLGFLAGVLRAKINRLPLRVPYLRWIWLVPLAYLPQWIAFNLPATREVVPIQWVSIALVSSQILLLVFCALNLRLPGFIILGLGLLANLIVISLNHGLMPISPETVKLIYPSFYSGELHSGKRLGFGKDIILSNNQTRLWWLSDTLILAIPLLNRLVAFSLGDLLIALGASWFCWELGSPSTGIKSIN